MAQGIEITADQEKSPWNEYLQSLSVISGWELADNTRKSYLSQWRRFHTWTLGKGISALPADPDHVATYLKECSEHQMLRPSTLNAAAASIAFVHKALELKNPCDSPMVKLTLKSATRKFGSLRKQAEALTAEVFAHICANACNPRRGRGGNTETPQTARIRGRTDIAIIGLMRDTLLRVSEAAVLKWEDIEEQADGSGRLFIRRSKTDAVGEGAVAFISSQTMEDLKIIRADSRDSDSVFGLRANQISRRIKKAAQAAGLGDGFSGHSPRVGMARDLTRAGTELHSLMTAGRWSSPRMPALYTRNETAARGAVAQYYNYRREVK